MKVWTDKEGKRLTSKEFGERWIEGIKKVTPTQQVGMQVYFTWLTIVGLLCGIIVTIIAIKTLWWLLIILVAGLGNTIVGLIGLYQKYFSLVKFAKLNVQEEIFNVE